MMNKEFDSILTLLVRNNNWILKNTLWGSWAPLNNSCSMECMICISMQDRICDIHLMKRTDKSMFLIADSAEPPNTNMSGSRILPSIGDCCILRPGGMQAREWNTLTHDSLRNHSPAAGSV